MYVQYCSVDYSTVTTADFCVFLRRQAMPSEALCNQLTLMSQALQQAVRIINAKDIQVEQTPQSLLSHDYHFQVYMLIM